MQPPDPAINVDPDRSARTNVDRSTVRVIRPLRSKYWVPSSARPVPRASC